MSAESERKIFWETFEEILNKNGNPFDIRYVFLNIVRQWAVVNNNKTRDSKVLEILFYKRGEVKVDIYIENDVISYKHLVANIDKLKSLLNVPVECVNGKIGLNTKHIQSTFIVNYGDELDYKRVILEIIPVVLKYKSFLEKYAFSSNEYIDY